MDQPRTVIGPGTDFNGKLSFEGTLRIDGTFTGEIVTNDTLIVSETARVNAQITCGTLIVSGEINGNIEAKTAAEFHKPAKIRGDVTTPSLSFEKGVFFHGQSRMVAEESEEAQTAAPAPSWTPSRPTAMPRAAGGQSFQVGDQVVVSSSGLKARVMSMDDGDRVKVLMGSGPSRGSVVSVAKSELSHEAAETTA
ncbi:MAG: polymer-forming cytoskeletal protein [Chloroflexi bacterium]|nr:polymer-forming cytoskeletal protein [Chloroflexota bacterium]